MSTAELPHAGPRLDFDPVRPDPQAKCYDLLFMRLFIGFVDRCIRLRVEEDASNEHLGGVHRHSQDDKWGRETDPGGFTSFAALRGSLQ